MINKIHRVSLVVGNKQVELEDNEKLNMRINSIVFDPTKIQSKDAEYSFTFNIPMSPNNIKIFDYANVMEKNNKFGKLWKCNVYADGELIFTGQLKIASIQKNMFKCNLVSVKINNVEEIFGESKMNEVDWKVDYDGCPTINSINSNLNSEYFFPLAAYGAFQKLPKTRYSNEINAYSSKYLIDNTNQIYEDTFSPSHRLLPLVKRMFEQKGYNVSGDIFEDEYAKDIYLSTHLGDEQIPLYNYGSPRLGKAMVTWSWRNNDAYGNSTSGGGSSFSSGTVKTLEYPKESAKGYAVPIDSIAMYDMISSAYSHTVNPDRSGMFSDVGYYTDNENLVKNGRIVIPADGLYKISLSTMMYLSPLANHPFTDKDNKTVAVNFTNMPIEVQLVRNTINGVELIYGYDGKYPSVYPHEAPPVSAGRVGTSTGGRQQGGSTSSGNSLTRAEGAEEYNVGYMPQQGELLAYDPWVNPDFVCGVSSVGNNPSVIKRGFSWNPESIDEINSRYYCQGYMGVSGTVSSPSMTRTTWNANTYPSAPSNFVSNYTSTQKNGLVNCVVELKAGDVLMCLAVLKDYGNEPPERTSGIYTPSKPLQYTTFITGVINIEAFSPKVSDIVDNTLTYYSPTRFDTLLQLGNFLNKDVKQSEFIDNFMKAFNLNFTQEGKNVWLNKNKKDYTQFLTPIKLDDRVNNSNIDILPIDYPKSMQVNYEIDDEEAGFYNSVPDNHINDDDWKDWADVGSDKIVFSTNDDADEQETNLSNSYCWYADFNVSYYDGAEHTTPIVISLPIISKDEYMIENYKPEESMAHDGKSLPQRWWFRQRPETWYLETVDKQKVYPSIPINSEDGFNLNYKNEKSNLLYRFFNITQFAQSDMIEFETYLHPREYELLKKGAPIRVNNDIYYTCKMTGYDPSGNNATKIQAMRKV